MRDCFYVTKVWRFRNIKPGGLRVLDKHLHFRFEGYRPAKGVGERKGVMTEFRSGVKWEEWGERVLLEVDELGELLHGVCVAPKFLDWKLEAIGGHPELDEVAWCFKPRTNRVYWRVGFLNELHFEDRLVCGHRSECEGQEVFNV